ncbi:hypothetical protein C2G38_2041062 [Gigaspora rosea]|uniref:Uncharacterized protein n=1 Tax=Gigaspora rosea TaxID=44941 RepID=A0A397UVF3_9GLOM|nr:hypothetical protein C2G38_2041062 [Gigaspora rosea]
MWNIFINYSRDTFSNYMDNTYVIQMNDSEILTADKSTGVDKGTGADMSIDKGIEVNNGMSVNKNVNKDAGVNEENTEVIYEDQSYRIGYEEIQGKFLGGKFNIKKAIQVFFFATQ